MASVQLKNLSKQYDNGFLAVHDISIDVEPGEFIALLGPSGCGKTTTLRMVAGLEEITSGDLLINGVRVNELEPRERDVAMVFQSYALYPHMTVFENMAFGLRIRKLPDTEIEQRVGDAARILGIQELLSRKPGQMSGGQRQRVAMGRAIVRRPKVFLFDEPLSNLDARLRTQMRMELGRLHRSQGATSLYVTHDQVEAMTLADRIVLMKDGAVQQIGAPLDLYDTPANSFVAEFMGHPTMNLLPGRIDGSSVFIGDLGFELARPIEAAERVQVGIRPHDLECHLNSTDGHGFTTEFIETTGHETLVHLRRGELRVTAVARSNFPVRTGENISLTFRPARFHVFCGSTGRRL